MNIQTFCDCINPADIYKITAAALIIGWLIGMASQRLGALWKARRG